MHKFFKVLLISILVTLSVSNPALAQRTTAAQPSVPGIMSLFFTDIGQRIQLWFTFNEEADTDLRLTFAEDNLSLANLIASANLGSAAEEKANRLAGRAEEFSNTVAERLRNWSAGDVQVNASLAEHAHNYFNSAEEVLAEINTKITDSEQKRLLAETTEKIRSQKITVEDFIKKGPNLRVRSMVEGGVIIRPTREADRDRDGIDDAAEADLGLSTENFDSDGDGLSDRLEIEKYGTDPSAKDSDGDGFKDGVEVLEGYNPRVSGKVSAGTGVTTTSLKFINTKIVKPQLKAETVEYLKAVVKNYEANKN